MKRLLSSEATARLFCLSLLGAALCFVAIFPMPYGYYMFLRWVITISAVAMAIALPRTGHWGVAIFAGAVAVLFNPIAAIPFSRDTWKWLDAAAGLCFLFFCIVLAVHRIRISPSTSRGDNLDERMDQVATEAERRIRDRTRVSGSDHVAQAIAVLHELSTRFDAEAWELISSRIQAVIQADPGEFNDMIRRGTPIRRWIWGAVGNTAGDLVESGEFHIYRGALDPTGPGDELVEIFDTAADELCQLEAADAGFAARQKASLRKNIAEIG